MSWELAAALFAIVIIAGVGAGLALRYGVNPEPADRAPPPPPPAGFRPRDARYHVPMFSTYDGAIRLQRARRAASEFIAEIGSTNEILPAEIPGIPRTGPRPLGPIDVDAMTRAIIAAWMGEEEPMVSVPIMKLGDIKVERNQAAIDDAIAKITPIDSLRDRMQARTDAANIERERLGLPPLATGGMVEPGKPYIVGETPSEQTRPPSEHPDKGDA